MTDIHAELAALPKMPPHEWQYASIIAFYSHRLREAEKHLRALKALAYGTKPDEWQAIHDARAGCIAAGCCCGSEDPRQGGSIGYESSGVFHFTRISCRATKLGGRPDTSVVSKPRIASAGSEQD